MSKEIVLPDMGDGITSGTVINIPIKDGKQVSEGETILEIETDKAVLPVPAPSNGTIEKIIAKEGATVSVGDLIVVLAEGSSQGSPQEKSATNSAADVKKEVSKSAQEAAKETSKETSPVQAAQKIAMEKAPTAKDEPKTKPNFNNAIADFSQIAAAPSARKLARELGIDLNAVTGSKRGGRIDINDVKNYAKNLVSNPSSGGGVAFRPLPDFSVFGQVEQIPLPNLRKTIASQMQYAWSSIPHVHQTIDIDLKSIEDYQSHHAASFKQAGSSLSVTLFLIKAMATCLREFPEFNSSLDIQAGVLWFKKYYHIGVAVDTPAGLIVPVLKNVDEKTIFDLGVELKQIAKKARERTLTPEDLKGSSMTISNLGGLRAGVFTPIVNPPEVAILGVATTEKRLAMHKDKVQEKTILPVILGYDHRVIDGANAARFVVRLKELMESPELILMGIKQKEQGAVS